MRRKKRSDTAVLPRPPLPPPHRTFPEGWAGRAASCLPCVPHCAASREPAWRNTVRPAASRRAATAPAWRRYQRRLPLSAVTMALQQGQQQQQQQQKKKKMMTMMKKRRRRRRQKRERKWPMPLCPVLAPVRSAVPSGREGGRAEAVPAAESQGAPVAAASGAHSPPYSRSSPPSPCP